MLGGAILGKRDFLVLSADDIKKYRTMFVELPPHANFARRIEDALAYGIPVEYLIDKNILTVEILKDINVDKDTFEYIKDYFEYKGIKVDIDWDSRDRVEEEDLEEEQEVKEDIKSIDGDHLKELEIELNQRDERIKYLEAELKRTIEEKELLVSEIENDLELVKKDSNMKSKQIVLLETRLKEKDEDIQRLKDKIFEYENKFIPANQKKYDCKVVGVFGRYKGLVSDVIRKENFAVVEDMDNADLLIITTDISKSSVLSFREMLEKFNDKNVLKILLMWDKKDPFSPESVVGTDLDLVVGYDSTMFKDSWLDRDIAWVNELNRLILERIA